MPALYPAQEIHEAIAAAQAEASTVPLREGDSDDETIKLRPHTNASVVTSEMFEGFSNFELDLSCLSRPTSPAPSSCSHLPPSTPSPPPSPPQIQHTLSRTRSFAQQAMAPLKKSTKKQSSAHLSSMTMPATGPRGSWPGMKFTGRGTPIDRSRAREWGNLITEEDEVAEDGVLFSAARSASLDSHVRPSQKSLSPEWNYLPPLMSASSSHAGEDDQMERESLCESPPALAPINLGSGQSDWDSIMQTVLGSKESQSSSSSDNSDPVEGPSSTQSVETAGEAEGVTSSADQEDNALVVPNADFQMMTPDQIEELHSGLESHLGIHQALDLGLGINITGGGGGMNLFKLGLLPSSESGRETPSIYSQGDTPRASRAPTILFHEQGRPATTDDSDHRSTTSTKAGSNGRVDVQVKSEDRPWWRKVLRGMRRIQETINIHKQRIH